MKYEPTLWRFFQPPGISNLWSGNTLNGSSSNELLMLMSHQIYCVLFLCFLGSIFNELSISDMATSPKSRQTRWALRLLRHIPPEVASQVLVLLDLVLAVHEAHDLDIAEDSCLYMCMCVCMYIYIYIHIRIKHIRIYICRHVCICTYNRCIHICVCIYLYIYIYIYIALSLNMYIYIYIHICV